MPLYIGIIEDEKRINRLYISSVSADDDRFETESVLADCSDFGKTSFTGAKVDLSILENKLRNGGIQSSQVITES